MTSHPDPSLLTALLRDREREADATGEEVAALRAEVERLRAFEASVWQALGTHPDLGLAHSAADSILARQEDYDCLEETVERHERSIDTLRAEVERLRARDARTTKRWENAECVLGYYKGLPIASIVRERDESDILLTLAMREGLTECERLRDEVAGLTAERDWLLNRYVDAMENQGARLKAFGTYARALREHEAHKSDPTRNVATGTALYAAEAAMRKLALEET